jgi:hypothetical protein
LAIAGVAAVIALVIALAGNRRSETVTRRDAVASDLTLPTGDRISTTPGAQLEVTNVAREVRTVRLASGTALFDVRPLGDREHFVVYTPDGDVTVVGTVFTVEVIAQSSIVRVYEGKVQVRRGRSTYTLDAGEELGRDGAIDRAAGDVLEVLASARARERAAAALARPASAVPPSPEPAANEPRRVEESAPPARRSGSKPGAAPDVPAPMPAPVQTPAVQAEAIALIAAGKFAEARDLSRAHGWHVIEGDAQRALGAYGEAAAAYERSVDRGEGDACVAALLAARVYDERLDNVERALQLLARAGEPACATRERALALTIQIATRLKRPELGSDAARAYVGDYPNGDQAAAAHALITN